MDNNYKELNTNQIITKTIRFNMEDLETNINSYINEHKNDYIGNLGFTVSKINEEFMDIIFRWSTYEQDKKYEIIGVKLIPTYRYQTIGKIASLKKTLESDININLIGRIFKTSHESDILLLISKPYDDILNNEVKPKSLVR